MKLLTKTNRYFIAASVITSILGCGIFYLIIIGIINDEIDERLTDKKQSILQHIQKHDSLSVSDYAVDSKVVIHELPSGSKITDVLKDTLIFDSIENEYIPYRSLVFPANVDNKKYLVNISVSTLESDDLIKGVIYASFLVIIILSISSFFINKWSSKRLWEPFYNTLGSLRNYDLSKNNKVDFDKTDITEFNELNRVLDNMTEKIKEDYFRLKEFTENASHELQTPLSVVKAKLELLYQYENLTKEQIELISSANEAIHKLAKLNSDLLLLAKIENRQFLDTEKINLPGLLASKIESFAVFAQDKNIEIQNNAKEKLIIEMNPVLAEIVFSNLLSNAIRHNLRNGKIYVDIKDSAFIISNTGESFPENTDEMFDRFKKSAHSVDSTGLGLSIVKQICLLYGYNIKYSVENSLHIIQISFRNPL